MKGIGRANDRPKQECITKEESSSPTIYVYALLGSCVIDAINNRKIITMDIPGVFLVMFHNFRWYLGCNDFSGSIYFHTFTWMFKSFHSCSYTITIYLVGYINISSPKVHTFVIVINNRLTYEQTSMERKK